MLNIRLKIILAIISIAIISSVATAVFIETLFLSDNEIPETGSAPYIRADLRNRAISGFSLLFLAVAGAAALSAFRFVRPFDDITIGMQVVSSGNLDHKIRKRSNDELGKLVDSFNSMIERLRSSQKKQSEFSSIAAIEKNKAELIIDSMADGVIVTDSKHSIVLMNPAAERLFDADVKNAIGKHIVNFLKKYRLEELFSDFPDMDSIIPLKEYGLKVREMEIEKPAKIIIKATIAPLRNETRHITGMVMVFEDITKQKEIDQMKTEFVSIVSHELKTPLTSIKGYAALLADNRMGEMNKKQARAVSIINHESDRLSDLINDILDLSKLESGKSRLRLSEVGIDECINESPMLSFPKKKNIAFTKIIPKNIPKITADKAKITQVFTNILSNAAKFTPSGGKITLKVMNLPEHIKVDITDTGIGIAKKDIPKLFNKFYQVESHLKRNQGGTGLGLPIVKEIIGLHHGLIGIRSAPGRGTTVSFILPKSPPSDSEQAKCWEKKNCRKTRCPAYNNPDKRCWLFLGTQCKKGSTESCVDKIDICRHCGIYREGTGDKQSQDDTKKGRKNDNQKKGEKTENTDS